MSKLPLLPYDVFADQRTFGESIQILRKWATEMNEALEELNGEV